MKIDPQKIKMDLSVRTMRHILISFENHYGKNELSKFIESTGMPLQYFDDENNWLSYDYCCDLLQALIDYTGDPHAPYRYGLTTATTMSWGILKTIITTFTSCSNAYKTVIYLSPRWAKNATFQFLELKKNKAIIDLCLRDNLKQDKNNCLNIQGQFASIPTVWGLPPARVNEIQCAAEGADSCIYEITWVNHPYKKTGLFALLFGITISFIIHLLMQSGIIYISMLPILSITAIFFMLYSGWRVLNQKKTLDDNTRMMDEQNRVIVDYLVDIEKLNDELQNKVIKRTKELRKSNTELNKTLVQLGESEEQLIKSEKMATVGRLAAGIAHELNNPVSAIHNLLENALENTSQDDSCRNRLINARKAANRCNKIVNNLLSFSGDGKDFRLDYVDINEIIENTVSNFLDEISNPNIEIINDFARNLPKIMIDSLQLQQVFMNIIMNAGDSIKKKGQVVIKTYIKSESVYIEIIDNGVGIPEDIISNIFDPFFSTKPTGKRKGLGLAISYNIIKRFNGDIQVKSKPGTGTTFTVIIPISVENRVVAG